MTDSDPQTPPGKQVPTRAEIDALVADNDARLAALSQQYGVQFNDAAIMSNKFDVLLSYLFGDLDDEPRRMFDTIMATHFRRLVDDTEVQVRKAVLTQGVQPSAGILIAPAGYRPKS